VSGPTAVVRPGCTRPGSSRSSQPSTRRGASCQGCSATPLASFPSTAAARPRLAQPNLKGGQREGSHEQTHPEDGLGGTRPRSSRCVGVPGERLDDALTRVDDQPPARATGSGPPGWTLGSTLHGARRADGRHLASAYRARPPLEDLEPRRSNGQQPVLQSRARLVPRQPDGVRQDNRPGHLHRRRDVRLDAVQRPAPLPPDRNRRLPAARHHLHPHPWRRTS
jgi:hypothetical protein